MKKATVLFSVFGLSTIHALFDVTANAGYMSSSLVNTATSGSAQGLSVSADGTGYIAYGAGHINFGLPALFTVGIGPAVGFGNQSLKVSGSTSTNSQNGLRFGGDAYIQFEMIPKIKPFFRVGFGKETLTNTNTNAAGNAVLVTEYGSLYYDFFLGLNIPIIGPLSFYLQAGPTGGSKGSASLKSYTLNGVAQAATLTPSDVSYSGFIASGGIMLSF